MNRLTRWGPYTNMREVAEEGPKVVTRAEGVYVYDDRGRRYLDAHGGLWLANAGYGRREIIQAIAAQAEALAWFSSFGGFANRPSLELAERLVTLLEPEGMSHVMFSNDGSEAVETALKMARQYWRLRGKGAKYKFITRQHAYHGVTFGALSVQGVTANRVMFEPLLPGIVHAPAPYAQHCLFHPDSPVCTLACARAVEAAIQIQGPDTVAAFIAEPVQAAGGVIIPPPSYLAEVREICRRYDVLFIADEVVTGFGRLGDWFGCRHYGVQPDIMTMAKGITSGYVPLGATAVSEEIFSAFLAASTSGPELRHGNTYSGHPIAAAAALANIDVLDREDLPGHAARLGPVLRRLLGEVQTRHPEWVVDANAEGLLGRLELKDPRPQAMPGALGAEVAAKMYDLGVIVRPLGDVITFSPPLVISESELGQMVAVTEQALASVITEASR
jgi:adenosylmethionine-8-amino-7-oxononanoate aminotransferase